MKRGVGRASVGSLSSMIVVTGALGCGAAQGEEAYGKLTGVPAEHVAVVSARVESAGMTVSVYAEPDGRYAWPDDMPEPDRIWARAGQTEASASRPDATATGPDTARPGPAAAPHHPDLALSTSSRPWTASSAAFLSLLPDDERTHGFIVDCTGCHQFDETIAFPEAKPRDREGWAEAITRMVETAGPGTGFPIISGVRSPEVDAGWLAEALAGRSAADLRPTGLSGIRPPSGTVLTEYDVPEPQDLPHDLMVESDGSVLVTGMFTHRMYRLDPRSGAWTDIPIPVQFANPRALDLDDAGRWYVVLGAPRSIAVHDPATERWDTHEVGVYPHSTDLGPDGRVWFNGHFSHDPEVLGALDVESGAIERFEVPPDPVEPSTESTISYGLRVAPDGIVWATQLRGNRLIRLDPASGAVSQVRLPRPNAGPRRPDVGVDGAVWIPEYGANRLTRFDPETETFQSWPLPVPNGLPYVVRVDRARGTVWIGTGAADAVFSFDPRSERFTAYPLPTRGALIRHLDVDSRNNQVWAAYGASPGIPAKIVRIQPGA